jgi:putative ABC transport system permease protein
VDKVGTEVEIGGLRAHVTQIAEGFSSFLGCPYVFTSYDDAARYLQIPAERTMAVAIRLADGASGEKAVAFLKRRLPEADVWTGPEFARRSGAYWMAQTGAGGAIALAGFLGFVVGVAIVSQAVYAATMEHIEEFATLRAMGASRGFILGLVLTQALGAGVTGWVLGSLVALPLAGLVRAHAVPWLQAPSWLVMATGLASLAMCALASVSAMRTAVSVDPGTVFRA